jgi:hypothetical protein
MQKQSWANCATNIAAVPPAKRNFLGNGVLGNYGFPAGEVADNVTLQEVRLAYLASCGPSAAMIRRTNASRVDGMISIIVVAEGP